MLNYLKQRWIPRIVSVIPINIWHRLTGIELVIPLWHVVSDQPLEHVSGIYKFRNVKQFKADLEYFQRHYTPISLHSVIQHLNGAGQLPKRCFLPTFDDGFREISDVVAPILHAKGIPAVFFPITSAIDNRELCYPQKMSMLIRALNRNVNCKTNKEVARILIKARIKEKDLRYGIRSISYRQRKLLDELGTVLEVDFVSYLSTVQPYFTSMQIKDLLKKGFDIGSHSVDHPLYSQLRLDEQLVQTWDSIKWLSIRFNYNCNSFAFPFSDAGISCEFFNKVFSDRRLQVSFGLSGLFNGSFSRNLTRFSMERTDNAANLILSRQFAKAFFRRK
jgi:peptidoglycan/xylan/chitin deacetylase (PgdA/CDA1 family)